VDANSWLLRGGTLVTVDKPLPVVRGDLLIIDGIIAAIGAAASSDPRSVGVPVLDVSGCVVLPGLVQAHIHLCQTLGRGLIGFLLRHAQHHRSGNVAEFLLAESHQDIAAHIGTVRELVSRNLSRLCAEGLIRIEGKRCLIPSLTILVDEHEGDE